MTMVAGAAEWGAEVETQREAMGQAAVADGVPVVMVEMLQQRRGAVVVR